MTDQHLTAENAALRRALAELTRLDYAPNDQHRQLALMHAREALASDTIGAGVWAVVEAAEELKQSWRGMLDDADGRIDHDDGPCPICDLRAALDRLREKGLLTASTDSPTEEKP